MFASLRGHLDVVEALFAKGTEVNAKNNAGVTALMVASRNGNAKVEEVLVKAGAK